MPDSGWVLRRISLPVCSLVVWSLALVGALIWSVRRVGSD
jgi:hypothetical protein